MHHSAADERQHAECRRQRIWRRREDVLGQIRRSASIPGASVPFCVAFFERGRRAAQAVCRITQNGQAIGTGFLVSPRLILTNNHVIGSPAQAKAMALEFDYELDIDNNPLPVSRFSLNPDEFFLTDDRDNLDYSVVAVGPRLSGPKELQAFGALPLSNARNKHALGDFVNIIQHPDGRLKEAVVRENQLVGRPADVGTVLHYVTDTEPGSSGSPVFNVLWNVVALHHWGGPHRDLIDSRGAAVPRTVNEGVRISSIFTDLNTRKSGLAGSRLALLEAALAFAVETGRVASVGDSVPSIDPYRRDGPSMAMNSDGTATWQIPLSISVRVGGVPAGDRSVPPPIDVLPPPQDQLRRGSEAKLELDERYANRTGYKPNFLSSTNIPMPKLSVAQKRVAAKNAERVQGDDPHTLRYEHFSLVMNTRRRLAFFTATNIDGAHAKDFSRETGAITVPEGLAIDDRDEGPEAAELWLADRRIPEEEQTPPNLFSGQTSFDPAGAKITNKQTSAHRNRIFQQGHLTRRQDPLWGTDATVIRANTDTFHVTNRAPQIGYFNMGTRKNAGEAAHPGGTLHWRALEEFVLANARADKKRVSVFTGPVFDDTRDFAWDRGRRDMRGFKVPRKFWKVVLRIDKGRLHATALVADQSPLIDFRLPEMLALSMEEARGFSFDKVAKYKSASPNLNGRQAWTSVPQSAPRTRSWPALAAEARSGSSTSRRSRSTAKDGDPRPNVKRPSGRVAYNPNLV